MLPKKLFCPKCLLPEREHAFKDDLDNFYNYIIQNLKEGEILTYDAYKKFYKIKKISMLHFSKRKEESAKEYYEVLFGEIQSFFFSDNINSQLFSIYSLYSIYYTQINNTFYQINTILEFLKGVNSLILKLSKEKDKKMNLVGATIFSMIKKMKKDEAFSIGVIPGLKSIILNKYGIPIERKENVYTYTKEINSFINELNSQNSQNSQNQNEKINEEKKGDNKIEIDYELLKKNIVNEIKELNMDNEEYVNYINNNYSENDYYNYGNRNNIMNNYNRYFNDANLKKEDLTPGEITQLDFLFNKYIK
jgi:hypothetical protein